jgi:hypothetical protein
VSTGGIASLQSLPLHSLPLINLSLAILLREPAPPRAH